MIRPEEIAARIRELCDERDINNYKLSKASGISMSALSHMFNRQTIPNVTTLIRICDGLGITLNELFDYGGLDRVHLTDETVRLLGFWNQLDSTERRELLYYLEWRSLKASEKSEKRQLIHAEARKKESNLRAPAFFYACLIRSSHVK